MNSTKFRVAIIGSGIGGLTSAIALSKSNDIQIDVYEAAHSYTEIGAGVGMWRRPCHAMRALGLEGPLSQLVDATTEDERVAFTFRKGDQAEGFTYLQVKNPMGCLSFHRGDFQKSLSTHLPTENLISHFSKRLISYTLPPSSSPIAPITLDFKDGTTAECDVLIAADGIHSTVRGQMYRDLAAAAVADGSDGGKEKRKELLGMVDPRWSGSVAYRGVVPCEKLEDISPGHRAMESGVNYMGKDKHIIVFPMAHNKLITVVAFCSEPSKEGTSFEGQWVHDVPQSELLEQYAGWEEEVTDLLKCVEKPSRWAINTVGPLPTFIVGRVVLLGDAAHAMTPHQGAGAAQAIEDAYILSALLTSPHATLTAPIPDDTSGNANTIINTVTVTNTNSSFNSSINNNTSTNTSTNTNTNTNTSTNTGGNASTTTQPPPTPPPLLEALKIYDAIRRPAGNDVQRRSRINGLLYEFNDARFPASVVPLIPGTGASGITVTRNKGGEKNKEKLTHMGEEIEKNWELAWRTDVEVQKDKALRMLEERVAQVRSQGAK